MIIPKEPVIISTSTSVVTTSSEYYSENIQYNISYSNYLINIYEQ